MPLERSNKPTFVHAICGRKFLTKKSIEHHHHGSKGQPGCWQLNNCPEIKWDDHWTCWPARMKPTETQKATIEKQIQEHLQAANDRASNAQAGLDTINQHSTIAQTTGYNNNKKDIIDPEDSDSTKELKALARKIFGNSNGKVPKGNGDLRQKSRRERKQQYRESTSKPSASKGEYGRNPDNQVTQSVSSENPAINSHNYIDLTQDLATQIDPSRIYSPATDLVGRDRRHRDPTPRIELNRQSFLLNEEDELPKLSDAMAGCKQTLSDYINNETSNAHGTPDVHLIELNNTLYKQNHALLQENKKLRSELEKMNTINKDDVQEHFLQQKNKELRSEQRKMVAYYTELVQKYETSVQKLQYVEAENTVLKRVKAVEESKPALKQAEQHLIDVHQLMQVHAEIRPKVLGMLLELGNIVSDALDRAVANNVSHTEKSNNDIIANSPEGNAESQKVSLARNTNVQGDMQRTHSTDSGFGTNSNNSKDASFNNSPAGEEHQQSLVSEEQEELSQLKELHQQPQLGEQDQQLQSEDSIAEKISHDIPPTTDVDPDFASIQAFLESGFDATFVGDGNATPNDALLKGDNATLDNTMIGGDNATLDDTLIGGDNATPNETFLGGDNATLNNTFIGDDKATLIDTGIEDDNATLNDTFSADFNSWFDSETYYNDNFNLNMQADAQLDFGTNGQLDMQASAQFDTFVDFDNVPF